MQAICLWIFTRRLLLDWSVCIAIPTVYSPVIYVEEVNEGRFTICCRHMQAVINVKCLSRQSSLVGDLNVIREEKYI
jgi:hypothetical protein